MNLVSSLYFAAGASYMFCIIQTLSLPLLDRIAQTRVKTATFAGARKKKVITPTFLFTQIFMLLLITLAPLF